MVFRISFALAVLLVPWAGHAQSDLLTDRNGDGILSFTAFGDSITYGLGDGIAPGETIDPLPIPPRPMGYPERVEALTTLAVDNDGIPGESFMISGLDRLPGVATGFAADVLFFLEGSNDAWQKVDPSDYERALQKAVNVTIASGRAPVLLTLPPPSASHIGLRLFTDAYTLKVKHIAFINEVDLVDLDRAWRTTCVDLDECQLYNLPDGFHPNTLGYDAMAQTVLATMYGIDIFSAGGAAELEAALGLAAGSVVVRPDPAA